MVVDIDVTAQGIVGSVQLGDTKDAVRARLGDFREFRRGGSPLDSDAFRQGIMATYDFDGRLTMLEIATPTIAHAAGVPLNDRPVGHVIRDLAAVGVRCEEVDVWGVDLIGVGVGLYIEGGQVAGVQVGSDEEAESVGPDPTA